MYVPFAQFEKIVVNCCNPKIQDHSPVFKTLFIEGYYLDF